MANKKTVVIGASDNPSRYSFQAVNRLKSYGHEVVPVGIRKGQVAGLDIHTDKPAVEGVDTVTLYVGPQNQPAWQDYILGLKPKRIIFNPGTENYELEKKAQAQGIQTMEACTLVMLSVGNY
ncbi:CoA-binding protein [Hymenobacter oligotrophus]|uniref:CoA-binding protein n=1 Tax=Hymenobacter oligotrophus TaxID=2319843 RepID=A0A3B7QZ97_9BACT|nr:CoA-binding protein [Hymenobacter oligotrophus]AYA36330.1 CoA-binding protein [Hymenobacter oligotrophus]